VEAGNGVVLASSDSVDFIGVCDRVIVLRHGRVAVELGCGDLSEGAIHRAIAGLEVDPLERL
jgi:ABC-type sugar transport system ATPase subunit